MRAPRRRRTRWNSSPARLPAALLLAAPLFGACGADAAGAAEPRLVDRTGSVTDSEFALPMRDDRRLEVIADGEVAGGLVVLAEPPAGWDLMVVWHGSPCNTAPTVVLTGTADTITEVDVDLGPRVLGQSALSTCPASMERLAVILRTAASPADDVVVTFSQPGEDAEPVRVAD